MILKDLVREGEEVQGGGRRNLLKRFLPWISTVLLLIYLYFKFKDEVSIDELMHQLEDANKTLFVLGILLSFIFQYLLDVFLASKTFTWFLKPLKMRDIWAVRGATYILMFIHHSVGQIAWIIYLMKKLKISFKEAISVGFPGILLFSYLIPLIATMILALSLMGHYPIEQKYDIALSLTFLLGWGWAISSGTFWIFGWKWPVMERFRDWPIFHALKNAKGYQWAALFGLMMTIFITIIFGQYICAVAFGLDMGFHKFLGRFLLVIPYTLIPSVGNMGPLTAGWDAAYSDVMSKEAIVACTVMIITMHHVLRAIIGFACLYHANKEVVKVITEGKESEAIISDELPVEQPIQGYMPEVDT